MDNPQWQYWSGLNQRLITEKLVRDSNRQQMVSSGILEEAGIALGSDQFVLLMVDILDYTPGKFDIYLMRKADRDAVMHSVIEQMFVTSFSRGFNAYSFLSDGQSYVLLNLQAAPGHITEEWLSGFMEAVTASCAECVQQARETYGIEIRVYVSSFISAMKDLGSSKALLDNMLVDDYIGEKSGGVFTADEMKRQMLAANAMNDQLHKLIQSILTLAQKHKLQEAGETAVKMLQLESQYYGIAAGTRSRLSSLITVLYAVMELPYFEAENSSVDIHEVLPSIDACLSSGELIDYVRQLFQDFDRYFSGTSKSKQSRVEDIAGYINANYSDPNLCAAMICDHFEISLICPGCSRTPEMKSSSIISTGSGSSTQRCIFPPPARPWTPSRSV